MCKFEHTELSEEIAVTFFNGLIQNDPALSIESIETYIDKLTGRSRPLRHRNPTIKTLAKLMSSACQ